MEIPYGKIRLDARTIFAHFGKMQNKMHVSSYFGDQLIEDTSDRQRKPEGKDDQGYRHDP